MEILYIVGENLNGIDTLKGSRALSYVVENILIMWPHYLLPTEIKIYRSTYMAVFVSVYRNFIDNCPMLEIIQCLQLMNRTLWDIHRRECQSAIKRNKPPAHTTTWINLKSVIFFLKIQIPKTQL